VKRRNSRKRASFVRLIPNLSVREDKAMALYNFDDSNIKWNKLGDLEHLEYSILNVDEKYYIVDILFKFDANKKIVLHRHMVHNNTFVVQGEHRLYEPHGEIKEIRPVGSYKSSPPGDVHREGGGPDQDVVVFFNIRGHDGVLYEVLDDDQNIIGTLSYADFLGLYKEHQGIAAAK
jgi:quercetin dioxygenase-like cupin family protein